MTAKALRVAAFLGCLAAAATPAAATNLLTNPGFETGDFSGWTPFLGTEVTSLKSHTGNFSAVGIGTRTDFSGDALGWDLFYPSAPVPTRQIAEFSFWGSRVGGWAGIARAIYSDGTADFVDFGFVAPLLGPDGEWVQVDFAGVLPQDKSLAGFRIFFQGDETSPFYVDDFVLRVAAVPEAPTAALLLAGLVALRLRAGSTRQRGA